MTSTGSPRVLPDRLAQYLRAPSLGPLWAAVRDRLERNGLSAHGLVGVLLDDDGADRLAGLVGTPIRAGAVRVRLDRLDAALRSSAAAVGVVTAVAELTGSPLVDRRAARAARQETREQSWVRLDELLKTAGLAGEPWVATFIEGLRRSGLLTRAGATAAAQAVEHAGAVLAELSSGGAFVAARSEVADVPRWELAELASRCTGNAHDLDPGQLVGAIVLRAAAAAADQPVPRGSAHRRELWARLKVTSDLVSGTALTWGLRPVGPDKWAQMMRARADMGVVTHLTLQELRAYPDVALSAPGQVVFACENPQVLQAAARAEVHGPLVCLAGNPSGAGWALLRKLLEAGASVRYHGDFDWPGVAIAGRVIASGALPWRLSGDDYDAALAQVSSEATLPLSDELVGTVWDPRLAARMTHSGVAIHEESILETLLGDLLDSSGP